MNKGIIWLDGTEPYQNLAVETACFKGRHGPSVLLWQNREAVFIGRNQSPWHELQLQALYRDNIPLLRRYSGGGTVYHDLGNLNISFIDGASKSAHFEALKKTFSQFDIPIVVGHRGELTVQGYKVSGSAYYFYQGRMLHHLTLLFQADIEKLWRYLKRDGDVAASRAVPSVRQAVANLSQLYPRLCMEDFVSAFSQQWSEVGATRISPMALIEQAQQLMTPYRTTLQQLKSWDWAYGNSPEFITEAVLLGHPVKLQIKDGLVAAVAGQLPAVLQPIVDQRLYSPYIEAQWQ